MIGQAGDEPPGQAEQQQRPSAPDANLRIERGAHLPSLPTLDRLAVALQCAAGDLLSTEGPEEASEAAAFGAWISELGSDDRAFVMTVVRSCCDYLGSRSK